ncbi:Two component system histidine kinase [Desulfonema magnum]|uniref:Chemotaxis protein CheA n=1 Tax=Desulfonema magnum TaxID=45655 RepID=A0A975BQ49_9BACT|nr:Two component system histidine kinase [Desulfonema magnum]
MKASLNEAAALFMKIKPNDLFELSSFQELLYKIAVDDSYPEISRKKILQAARKIEGIIDVYRNSSPETDSAKSDLVNEIGDLIKDAVNVMEKKGTAGTAIYNYISEDADIDMLEAFISESTELISKAEEALILLDTDPENTEAVDSIFRVFHNIKGTSSFFKLSLLSEMAHGAESFLNRIRDRKIRYTPVCSDLILRSVDMFKELFGSVQNAMTENKPFLRPDNYNDLMRVLAKPEKAGLSDIHIKKKSFSKKTVSSGKLRGVPPAKANAEEKKTKASASNENDERTAPKLMEAEASFLQDKEQNKIKQIKAETLPLKDKEQADIRQIRTEPPPCLSDSASSPQPRKRMKAMDRPGTKSFIRIPVRRLDRFVDMVGELVLAHAMIVQDETVTGGKHYELLKKIAGTSKIIRELQHMSMAIRMISLKKTFWKMTRLVTNLAERLGKEVVLVTKGEETEIDRNMAEMIKGPLAYILRGVVNNNIELPDIREKMGKPRCGTLHLSAYHSGSNVVVKIEDDGQGLDRKAILAKAVRKGLIRKIPGQPMSDQEVFNFLFEPEFFADKGIADFSGRDEKADVLKKNIQALRGDIEFESDLGKGSVFKINLPLTLAIIDGMLVRVGREKYVIPLLSIVRSVQPSAKDISTVLHQGEVLCLQEKLVPILRLADLFEIEDAEQDITRAIVIVIEKGKNQAGVLVDELIGSQQIVIKTLGETIQNIPGISGSSIMPDGRVGLILDVRELVRLANMRKYQ